MAPPRFDEADRQPLLPPTPTSAVPPSSWTVKSWSKAFLNISLVVLVSIGTALLLWSWNSSTPHSSKHLLSSQKLQTCAWKHLNPHTSLLDVPPVSRDEYLSRQSILASALSDAGVDAFIAEPSASSSYYVNISTSYELSERPFLILISSTGKVSYLAPAFEINRISALPMVSPDEKAHAIAWREEEHWYNVLKREVGYEKVMLDEHTRFMIASGLESAGIEVVPSSPAIQALRSVKSAAELVILKGINAFTLQLVRSLQLCIPLGITQEAVVTAAQDLFDAAGIGKGFWAIVLFGSQAANPHGGSLGATLQDGEFVLIDIGSSLHGYGSDVTRTILPVTATVSEELLDVWWIVHAAQGAAIERMKANETCKDVDAAARDIIRSKGMGEFFTHRLGHGLGLEMHEHPYLNGANEEKLKVGEVVTNEPVSLPLVLK
jgi:Xaa-Pro aminopeptidase